MQTFNNESTGGNLLESESGSRIIQMGRYASKKNKRGPSTGDSSESTGTFSWTLLLVVYLTAFTLFQSQMQSIVLWNDVWTLFGLISWTDMTLGIFLFLVMVAGVDLARRGASFVAGFLFFGTMILSLIIIGASFTSLSVQTAFLNTAVATAALGGLFILVFIGGRNGARSRK